MNIELRVALISNDAKFNHDMRSAMSKELAHSKDEEFRVKVFTNVPTVEEAIVHFSPHLIIVNLEPDMRVDKLAFLDHLSRISGRIPVVGSAPQLDADLMLTCIKKGVRDFIKQPLAETEVHEVLSKLLREPTMGSQERQLGTTYIFFSYKGGIGTTFLACNTAVSLARLMGARVLLWDLVLQNGDIPFFFDYEPQATLTDLIDNITAIDENYIRATLPLHSSGITILAGPKRPEEAEVIRNDQIQQLHQILRKHFDYIVIDGGHSLTDNIISTMDISRHILLTTDLHLPVLKNTLRCLEIFERLGYVEGKFKVLLNRYNSKYEKFDLTKAQEILHYPIAFAFSNDYSTVSRSLNSGLPVADLDKDATITEEFNELAKLLTHDFKVDSRKSSSPFGGLFKGILGGSREKKKKKEKKEKPEDTKKAPESEEKNIHAA